MAVQDSISSIEIRQAGLIRFLGLPRWAKENYTSETQTWHGRAWFRFWTRRAMIRGNEERDVPFDKCQCFAPNRPTLGFCFPGIQRSRFALERKLSMFIFRRKDALLPAPLHAYSLPTCETFLRHVPPLPDYRGSSYNLQKKDHLGFQCSRSWTTAIAIRKQAG